MPSVHRGRLSPVRGVDGAVKETRSLLAASVDAHSRARARSLLFERLGPGLIAARGELLCASRKVRVLKRPTGRHNIRIHHLQVRALFGPPLYWGLHCARV